MRPRAPATLPAPGSGSTGPQARTRPPTPTTRPGSSATIARRRRQDSGPTSTTWPATRRSAATPDAGHRHRSLRSRRQPAVGHQLGVGATAGRSPATPTTPTAARPPSTTPPRRGRDCGSAMLAAWTYDTLAPGQPTTSRSPTSGGTSGTSYDQSVIGYNSIGLPQGRPDEDPSGVPLAGTYKDTEANYLRQPGVLESTPTSQPAACRQRRSPRATTPPTSRPALTAPCGTYVGALDLHRAGPAPGVRVRPDHRALPDLQRLGPRTTGTSSTERGPDRRGTSPVTVDDTRTTATTTPARSPPTPTPRPAPSRSSASSTTTSAGCPRHGRRAAAAARPARRPPSRPGPPPPTGTPTPTTPRRPDRQVSTPASGTATDLHQRVPRHHRRGRTAGHREPDRQRRLHHQDHVRLRPRRQHHLHRGRHHHRHPEQERQPATTPASSPPSPPRGGTSRTTSYVYDACGSLLLQADGLQAPPCTCPARQLTSTTSGTTTTTSTRYYAIGGHASPPAPPPATSTTWPATSRAPPPSRSTATAWPSPTGTTTPTASQSAPRRPPGPAPTASSRHHRHRHRPDNLGAREYNPATWTFISPDPS